MERLLSFDSIHKNRKPPVRCPYGRTSKIKILNISVISYSSTFTSNCAWSGTEIIIWRKTSEIEFKIGVHYGLNFSFYVIEHSFCHYWVLSCFNCQH